MRKRASVLVAVMLALVAPAARGESRTVVLRGTAFDRPQIEISPGDTVVWKHESGNARHTVTFDDRSFDSHPACPALLVERCLRDGETVQRQFTQPGTFSYHCKIHKASGMVGTVVVLEPAAGPTSTTTPGGTATTRPSSSPTTEGTAPPTAQTSRPPSTKPTVIRSTTTTTGPVTTPADKNEPPAFDPDSPEEVAKVNETEPGAAAGAASGGDDRGSGPVALIAGLLVAVAAGGAFLLWRLRPVRRPA